MTIVFDRERQLRSRLTKIDDAVRRISGGLYWSVSRANASRQVGQYITDLIASLATADGSVSPDELELIAAHFSDGSVERVAESARTNFYHPPAFIQAAATYDAAQGTSLVAELRQEVLGVCELVAYSDRELSSDEADIIEAVRHALSSGGR